MISCTEKGFSGSAVAAALRSRSQKHKRFRQSIVAKSSQNVNKCIRLIYILIIPAAAPLAAAGVLVFRNKNKKLDWASGLWSKPANGRAVRAAHCPHAARQAQCGQLAHRRWRRLSTGAVLAPVDRPVVHHEANQICRQGFTGLVDGIFPLLVASHYMINK